MPKRADLTLRERTFVAKYVENHGNGMKAAEAAYNVTTPNSAMAVASETLRRPMVKAAIVEALDRAGVTTEFLAKKHRKALGWIDHAEVPRAALGVKALGLAYKVRGELQETPQQPVNVIGVNVAIEVLRELVPLAEAAVDTETWNTVREELEGQTVTQESEKGSDAPKG